jgi:DNA-binding beta-propeller fold protein YncE
MKCAIFLAAIILVLSMVSFFQPTLIVNAQPNAGDYIVAEYGANVLSRVTPSGVRAVICTFPAGAQPMGVAIDSAGNYIVTEFDGNVLSKVTPEGVRAVICTFATGTQPMGVAIDWAGNYIVVEYGANVLSKVTPEGVRAVICTFPESAYPCFVSIDSGGNYIVTESDGNVLSRVTPDGVRTIIYTFPAGSWPYGVAIDSAGNYIVVERFGNLVSKVTPGGVRTIISSAFPSTATPIGVAVDSGGNYIVTETNGNVLSRIAPSGVRTVIYTFPTGTYPWSAAIVPGIAPPPSTSEDYIVTEILNDGNALSRVTPTGVRTVIYTFSTGAQPMGVANDSAGNYIVTEYSANVLSRITPSGVITMRYVFPSTNGGWPTAVAIDSAGNYIVTEFDGNVLSRVTSSGVRTVIYTFPAGTSPRGVAIDSEGNYIVTEYNANVLSKVTPTGVRTVIYTFATGTQPMGVAIDWAGNYIVTEGSTNVLSLITPGGVRTAIYMFPTAAWPTDVAIDSAGNYIVTEYSAHVLSKVTPSGARTVMYTFATTFPSSVAIVPSATAPAKISDLKTLWKDATIVLGWSTPHGPLPSGAMIDDTVGAINIATSLGHYGTADSAFDTEVSTWTSSFNWKPNSPSAVISIGGTAVNLVSNEYNRYTHFNMTLFTGQYVELKVDASGINYVRLNFNPQQYIIHCTNGTDFTYSLAGNDFAEAYAYHDQTNGKNVYLVMGIRAEGTVGTSRYLAENIATFPPNVAAAQGIILRWNDANADGIARANEMTVIATYP